MLGDLEPPDRPARARRILDDRTDDWVPTEFRGNSEKKRAWAIQEMKDTARAAAKLGVKGGQRLHRVVDLAPALLVPAGLGQATIADGFKLLADRWNPILDVFKEVGVKFALEVHPTEIAFDLYSAQTALEAMNHRPEFGFNFDPSHLLWQFVDPVAFIRAFPDRIYHVHVKDAARTLDGKTGILGSHLNFGDPDEAGTSARPVVARSTSRRSPERSTRSATKVPLSVEWEDPGMDREYGAAEAATVHQDQDGLHLQRKRLRLRLRRCPGEEGLNEGAAIRTKGLSSADGPFRFASILTAGSREALQ